MASQEAETDDKAEMAELRDEYPSGWCVLTQHDTVSDMIDALMDAPDYHFSKSKLSENAGVSRQSVHTHPHSSSVSQSCRWSKTPPRKSTPSTRVLSWSKSYID